MDILLTITASTTISAGIVGFGVWLGRSWISEHLKNSIRSEYDQRLETHKAQLKTSSDVALEKLRADLSIAASERQIRFTKLHDERALVIAQTYSLLVDLHGSLSNYVKIFEPTGEAPRNERGKAVAEAHQAFISYYPKKRIFLPEPVVTQIDSINRDIIDTFYSFLHEVDARTQAGTYDGERWMEISTKVSKVISDALNGLGKEFRALLGDS